MYITDLYCDGDFRHFRQNDTILHEVSKIKCYLLYITVPTIGFFSFFNFWQWVDNKINCSSMRPRDKFKYIKSILVSIHTCIVTQWREFQYWANKRSPYIVTGVLMLKQLISRWIAQCQVKSSCLLGLFTFSTDYIAVIKFSTEADEVPVDGVYTLIQATKENIKALNVSYFSIMALPLSTEHSCD